MKYVYISRTMGGGRDFLVNVKSTGYFPVKFLELLNVVVMNEYRNRMFSLYYWWYTVLTSTHTRCS